MGHLYDFSAPRVWREWTEEEVWLLRSGQPVPTRSKQSIRDKRSQLRIYSDRYHRARSLYTPPEQKPGEIPWPSWWRRAQRLRATGYGAIQVARILGRRVEAVQRALYPGVRDRLLRKAKKDNAKSRADPAYRERDRIIRGMCDRERDKARKIARAEWRQDGGDPWALERYYRKYECL